MATLGMEQKMIADIVRVNHQRQPRKSKLHWWGLLTKRGNE